MDDGAGTRTLHSLFLFKAKEIKRSDLSPPPPPLSLYSKQKKPKEATFVHIAVDNPIYLSLMNWLFKCLLV